MNLGQQACIDACLRCLRDAERYLQACLVEAARGKPLDDSVLRACRDCVDICSLCASLLLREDVLSGALCAVAALLCRRCAAVCERYSANPLANKCAQSALACARCCQQLAGVSRLKPVVSLSQATE